MKFFKSFSVMRSISISKMIKIILLTTGCLILLISYPLFAQNFTIEKIMDYGNDESRLVMVVLGDGYIDTEMLQYQGDVDNLLSGFFSTTPWAEYKNYINVYRINVISNQSGSDHPSGNLYVDTALDAVYHPPQHITISYSKLQILLDNHLTKWDYYFTIVNDPVFAGKSAGQGVIVTNHAIMVDMALHEFGHTFAHLVDEYENAPWGPAYTDGPNVTFETQKDNIPWKSWIEDTTPIPTPELGAYNNVVGLFEGAACNMSTGIYRPYFTCRMREAWVPFCPVCAQAQILKLYSKTQIIEQATPANSEIIYSDQNSLQFGLTLIDPNLPSFIVTWEVDNIAQQFGGDVFTLENTFLDGNAHTIKATVRDNTPLVREDPQGRLISSHVWTFKEINHPPAVPSNPSPTDNAVDQPLTNLLLSWEGDDPDPSDTLKYDVYMDQNTHPSTLVSFNQEGTVIWSEQVASIPIPHRCRYQCKYFHRYL